MRASGAGFAPAQAAPRGAVALSATADAVRLGAGATGGLLRELENLGVPVLCR